MAAVLETDMARVALLDPPRPRTTWWRPGLVLSAAVLVVVLLAAIAPGPVAHLLAAGQDPFRGVPADKLQAPGGGHLFGTDQLGRDVLARVIHGAGLSVRATLSAVGLAAIVGGLAGLLSGFLGGVVDSVLMRIVDVLQAIPALLLSLAVITALGYGPTKVAIAVGVAIVAGFARLMRAEVLRVRHAVYVEAAHAVGAGRWRILFRHVLPNAIGPVIVLATLEFGVAFLSVAALGFLGYGAPAPQPEWGALIADGRDYLAGAWWLSTLPGVLVAATVLSLNRVARALDREVRR